MPSAPMVEHVSMLHGVSMLYLLVTSIPSPSKVPWYSMPLMEKMLAPCQSLIWSLLKVPIGWWFNLRGGGGDVSFSCVVKTQRRWSNKIYKTELTKTRYNNQVLGKYRVDPQRAGLTLIAELTWSNLGLERVLNERK